MWFTCMWGPMLETHSPCNPLPSSRPLSRPRRGGAACSAQGQGAFLLPSTHQFFQCAPDAAAGPPWPPRVRGALSYAHTHHTHTHKPPPPSPMFSSPAAAFVASQEKAHTHTHNVGVGRAGGEPGGLPPAAAARAPGRFVAAPSSLRRPTYSLGGARAPAPPQTGGRAPRGSPLGAAAGGLRRAARLASAAAAGAPLPARGLSAAAAAASGGGSLAA